jgi:protein TonB
MFPISDFQTKNNMKYIILTACMMIIGNTTMGQEPPPVVVDSMKEKEQVFMVVEEMPRFPGCEELDKKNVDKQQCAQEKMMEYIYATLVYPEAAMKDSLQGQVITQFTVGKDGTLSDIIVVRGQHQVLNAEAIRVIESMNHMEKKWRPGMHKGRPTAVRFTLPMKFSMKK